MTAEDAPHVAQISVAVATVDRPRQLTRCLQALLTAEVVPAEVIVVDQGTDGADRAIASLQTRGVPIHHLRQPRRGLSAARNLAVAAVQCPAVAVTDDDCVPGADWIATIERALAAGSLDAVTGRVLPLGDDEPGLYAIASRVDRTRRDFVSPALPWEVGTGANFAGRVESLRRVGGYDERLGAGTRGATGEDIDLLYRLLRAGCRVRFEPEAIVFHERGSRSKRRATRWSYGRGIGACCGVWLRSGDVGALRVLGGWTVLRLRLLARAVVMRRPRGAGEELQVLAGTVLGLAYGLSCARNA
jgi:GT2 family glycosyltransferase